MKDLGVIIAVIITIALCCILTKWIVNSDMPLWLKIMLLR